MSRVKSSRSSRVHSPFTRSKFPSEDVNFTLMSTSSLAGGVTGVGVGDTGVAVAVGTGVGGTTGGFVGVGVTLGADVGVLGRFVGVGFTLGVDFGVGSASK